MSSNFPPSLFIPKHFFKFDNSKKNQASFSLPGSPFYASAAAQHQTPSNNCQQQQQQQHPEPPPSSSAAATPNAVVRRQHSTRSSRTSLSTWRSSCGPGARKPPPLSDHVLSSYFEIFSLPYADDSDAVTDSECDTASLGGGCGGGGGGGRCRRCRCSWAGGPPPLPPPHHNLHLQQDQDNHSLASEASTSGSCGHLHQQQHQHRCPCRHRHHQGSNHHHHNRQRSHFRSLSRKNSYCSHASRWSYSSHVGAPASPLQCSAQDHVNRQRQQQQQQQQRQYPQHPMGLPHLYRSASRSGSLAEEGYATGGPASRGTGGGGGVSFYAPAVAASDDHLNASFPPDYFVSLSPPTFSLLSNVPKRHRTNIDRPAVGGEQKLRPLAMDLQQTLVMCFSLDPVVI